ncbi:hypothetical protein EST38_g7748 [Candolleomyces aberdarensis]|uniref:Uncharacterized protein n=1 Tax=Candolleomyces aberdarensis TaxID=2316362 RepID=A0A4Q2DEC8_9AGAR|nr:hypothetical protein EST38_g7748 [Candolleomyces aberdarensis]
MSLEDRLKFNKEVERDNDILSKRRRTFIRTQKKLPETADIADDASFLTFSEEDKASIILPDMWSRIQGLLHTTLLRELMDRHPNLGSQKRKLTDAHISDDSDSESETRPAKSRHHAVLTRRDDVERTYGAGQVQPIPDALLITDAYHSIPISWLTNKALSVLNSFMVGGVVPTKRYTNTNYTSSITMWDISAIMNSILKVLIKAGMTKALIDDFGEYQEAVTNHIRLARMRDKREGQVIADGQLGRHERWASDHHGFFSLQKQKSGSYLDWRGLEAELREERNKSCYKFDLEFYVTRNRETLLEAKLKQFVGLSSSSGESLQNNQHTANQSFRNFSSAPTRPAHDSQSSPCIICAIQGHSIQGHDHAIHPKCLSNRKPLWAKKKVGKVCSLYNNSRTKEVCINYNYISKKPCTTAPISEFTAAPSAAATTQLLVGSVISSERPDCTLWSSVHPPLQYTDFSSTVNLRFSDPSFNTDLQRLFHYNTSPYEANTFDSMLRDSDLLGDYPLLCDNLRNGFPLSDMPPLASTVIHSNLTSCDQYRTEVMAYLDEEITAGQMSGRYTLGLPPPVERYFNPPFVAEVPYPTLESSFEADVYQVKPQGYCIQLGTSIPNSRIANAPPGTQACTLNIAKYHRTCPVLPSHKCWLVMRDLDGMFIIDHVHLFGCTCASGNTGMIGNAAVDIWRVKKVAPILKYEDNLNTFRTLTPDGTSA